MSCVPRGKLLKGTPEQFEARRLEYNKELRTRVREHSGMQIYNIRGFMHTEDGKKLPLSVVSKDDVHPNTPEGAKKYMDALNGALIAAGGAYKNHMDSTVEVPSKLKPAGPVSRRFYRGPVPRYSRPVVVE